MKKVFYFLSVFFLFSEEALAQIGLPRDSKPAGIPGDVSTGRIVSNFLQIMFIVGALGAVVFMVWGAMDWVLSGGDKEKLAGAQKKITTAIIGLVLLGLSAFIITLIGEILGFGNIFLDLGELPVLGRPK